MLEASLTGIFPRNDELIRTWKDFEWNRIPKENFIRKLKQATKELIDRQINLGYDVISYPMLEWHDLFRPFINLDNISLGPLTRFFETNTFYKQPIFQGEVHYTEGLLKDYISHELMPKNLDWKISLPGPYTFLRLSKYKDLEITVSSIKDILINALKELNNIGFHVIDFHEPSLGYDNSINWNIVYKLYEQIINSGYKYRLNLYFGPSFNKMDKLIKLGADAILIDLYLEDFSDKVKKFKLKKLGLGIVNSYNTLLENIKSVTRLVSDIAKNIGIPYIIISNNSHLEYLPYHVALRKMDILIKIYKKVNSVLH